MKDVVKPLRTGYFELLTGITDPNNKLYFNDKPVGVFDSRAPHPAKTPYVILSDISTISENTKTSFGNEVTVNLLVYTTFEGDFGGREDAEDICNQILEMIIPRPGWSGVQLEDFNVSSAVLIGMDDEDSYSDTKYTYRKRITIQHLVWQNRILI